MLEAVLGAVLGAVLILTAGAKLARPAAAADALGSYGLPGPGARRAALAAVILAELALGAAVAAGVPGAPFAAAALLLGAAAVLLRALRAGHAGRPCGCLGARGRIGRAAVARALVLAAAFAALPLLPDTDPSAEAWLTAGLALALLGLAGLAIAVLALAREVGELRLRVGSGRGALEVLEEGPELGSRSALAGRFAPEPEARFLLALFTSDGCPLCRTLEPAARRLGRDPLVALETFDEVADAGAWDALDVPGSPFAVAMALDGTVLAKGTPNDGPQLESVLAAAERRLAQAAHGVLDVVEAAR